MNGLGWPPGSILKHWIDAATNCPPDLSPAVAEAQIAEAPLAWSAVANVTFERTDDRSAAQVLSYWDPSVHTDDPYYLAETDEPSTPSAATQLRNRIDPNVVGGWTPLRLYQCEIHEFGHALGQVHSPAGVSSIMSATLDETLDGLTPFDIANVQADYGAAIGASITLALPDGGSLVYTGPFTNVSAPAPGPFAPTVVPLPDGGTLTITYVPPKS